MFLFAIGYWEIDRFDFFVSVEAIDEAYRLAWKLNKRLTSIWIAENSISTDVESLNT